MSQHATIETGIKPVRRRSLVAKADGSAITSGTVNYYLKAITGTNAGKWWKQSDESWNVSETANAMTHQADGNWTIDFTSNTTSPFSVDGAWFIEYAKESGDLHVAGEGQLFYTEYTPSATSSRRVDVGVWLGAAVTLSSNNKPDTNVDEWHDVLLATTDNLDAAITSRQAVIWTSAGATVNLSATTIKTATDVEADTQDLQARVPAALTAGGNMKSDALALGGTSQTGRDIGASVLLSSGTGTGQLKLASGYVSPNWADVGSPTTTVNLSGTTVKAVTQSTPALIADQVWDEILSGHLISGSTGDSLALTPANSAYAVWNFSYVGISGGSFGEAVHDLVDGERLDLILDGILAGLTDGSIVVGTINDKTGYGLAADGADILVLPSGLITALSIAASALDGKGDWPTQASVDGVDAKADTIIERTANLPDDPADQSLVIAATDAIVSAITALNNLSSAQAQSAAAAALTAWGKTGFSLGAAGIDAILAESGISASAALTDDAGTQLTEINLRQAVGVIMSAIVGVLAGAAGPSTTTKPAGKPAGNTRVTSAVDATGRTAVTLKVPT